jgi:adenylate cyclase
LAPMFAAAHAGLSGAYVRAGTLYLTMPLDDAIRFAIAHARKAVELDPTDADAQADLAWDLRFQGDMDNALVIARHALSINSNSARAHLVMGLVLIFIGRTEEGRQTLDAFVRLSPRDAGIPTAHHQKAISYYFDRNYERCAEAARHQLSTYPGFTLTYRWLAAALGQLGRSEEARAALNMTLTQSPREFEVYVHSRVPWMRPEDHEHMLDGLRKAGWRG